MRHHLLLIGAVLASCKGDPKSEPPAPTGAKTVEAPAQPAEKPTATAATFGKTVAAPFGPAAKLKLGATVAEAKTAAPALFSGDTPAKVNGTGDDLTYQVEVEGGRVVGLEVSSTTFASLAPLVTAAWGPGTEAKNSLGGKRMAWFSPELATRAFVEHETLHLHEYVPLATLLGPDKLAIAALPKRIIGATLEDLKRDYASYILKPDDKITTFYLPPAEWDRDHVEVVPMFAGKPKASSYSVTIDDASFPGGKDASLAAFTKKWGKPRVTKAEGSPFETWIFHANNPLITVQRGGTNDSAWVVEVRQHDDECGDPCYP